MADNTQQRIDEPTRSEQDELIGDAVQALADWTTDAVTATPEFSVDSLFEILADPGRRFVLTYVLEADDFVSCSELVDHVVDATDHSMTDSEFRRRVTAELTHIHLPRLHEAGLIEYNIQRQLVAPTPTTRAVLPYLRLALAQQNANILEA